MKTRSIKIVCHVGIGKTGTTFLQKSVQEISDVGYLGKFYSSGNVKYFCDDAIILHYDLFRPFRGEIGFSFNNPSISNFHNIEAYSDVISAYILREHKKTHFIISDECIYDYANYIGEWNQFNLIALINRVEQKVKNSCEVEKILSYTIRRQWDWLPSFYAFSRGIYGNFGKFLECTLSNSWIGAGGGLHYAENIEMVSSVAADWRIEVTPSEVLLELGNSADYLRRVFCFPEELDLSKFQGSDVVNGLRLPSKTQTYSLKRKYLFIGALGFRWRNRARFALYRSKVKLSIFYKVQLFSLFITGGCLMLFDNWLRKFFPWIAKREFSVTPAQSQMIFNAYMSSNEHLKRFLSVSELEKFGYVKKIK